MSAELFNSISGYSVGIPPKQIADASGNIVTNVNYPAGNVSANVIYANVYRYANGVPFSTDAGGSDTQLQYNNNGSFAGISTVTWDGSALSLGNISNVKITGGLNGYFLQTDGSGNLTWSPVSGGTPGNGEPGGANTQVQFNDEGNFGGDAGFTYNKDTNTLSSDNIAVITANITTINATTVNATTFTGDGSQLTGIVPDTANYVIQPIQANITQLGTLTELDVSGNSTFQSIVDLGDVANVKISGGLPGYVLTTDGTGNVSWESSTEGDGTPGGANTQIQFNNNGNFDGTAAFTFNNVSNSVNLTGNLSVRNLTANNATYYGNITATGNITGNLIFGNGTYLTNVFAETSNTVISSSQPNITSVGTLIDLTVSNNIAAGQTITAGAFQTSGNIQGETLTANVANIATYMTANGIVDFANTTLIDMGSVSNVRMGGGINGYVLTTNGAGTLTWQPVPTGSGSLPGGLNTQVQYNDNGDFGGSAFFTFNNSNNTVQVGGLLISNVFQLGSGGYKFGTSDVHFESTNTTNKTVIYSVPVTDCAGVEYDIISTNSVEQKRQFVKISSIYYAGQVDFNEYAGLSINGGVGTFGVEYNPGNVTIPPSVDLTITPNSANTVVYKMLITILAP